MINNNWIDCPNCKQGHLAPEAGGVLRELKPGFVRCDVCWADAPQEYSAGYWALTAINAVGFLVDAGEVAPMLRPQRYLDDNGLKPPTIALDVYFKMCWWEAVIGELMPGAVVDWIDREHMRRGRS